MNMDLSYIMLFVATVVALLIGVFIYSEISGSIINEIVYQQTGIYAQQNSCIQLNNCFTNIDITNFIPMIPIGVVAIVMLIILVNFFFNLKKISNLIKFPKIKIKQDNDGW